MEVWIARDDNSELKLFTHKPEWNGWKGKHEKNWGNEMEIFFIELFPEIKSGECKQFELREVQ